MEDGKPKGRIGMTEIKIYDDTEKSKKKLLLTGTIDRDISEFDSRYARSFATEFIKKELDIVTIAFDRVSVMKKFDGGFGINVYLKDAAIIRDILLKNILE